MPLYLGVDGGQSSTTALIGDETGRVLGYGRGGPCNHVKTGDGREKFTRAIAGCIAAAAHQAGLTSQPLQFAGACLGFSGGPHDKEQLLREMLATAALDVTDDARIALAGATGGAPGIIVIAGTGSISYGMNAAGVRARAGGWGYIFGDEGGAFDLVRQALRAALRMAEGWGPPTALHDVLLAETGADSLNDLLHRFYTSDFPRPRIAAYARLVDRVAQEGDGVAADLLHRAAQELATLVASVRAQLFTPGDAVTVAYIGGVFQSDLVRERCRWLVEMREGSTFQPPRYGPATGALLLAYRHAGPSITLSNIPEIEK